MIPKISIIIIGDNVANTISDCLRSCLPLTSEIILLTNSTDNTIARAKSVFPQIKIYPNHKSNPFNFAAARNLGLKYVNTPWVLYIDDDERLTFPLHSQIKSAINSNSPITNYDLPRANHFLGHRVHFGGTYPDYVKRLFLKKTFQGFQHQLHEQPVISGPSARLTADLIHLTHRSLHSMLQKSIIWTSVEAKLLYDSNHPPVVWWRFIRMMLTKVWERLIIQSMWRDGIVGWISVIFETYNTYMIYARLYELQHHSHA